MLIFGENIELKFLSTIAIEALRLQTEVLHPSCNLIGSALCRFR